MTNTTTTSRRGPTKDSTDLKLIAVVTGKTPAEVRAEALKIGTDTMIADLKSKGTDLTAIRPQTGA